MTAGPPLAAPDSMTKTQRAPRVAPQIVAADRTAIAQIMTRAPFTVHPELGLEDLVGVFLDRNLSRAPVIDADGRPIGMVSKTDLVVDQYMRGDTEVDQRGAGGASRHVHELGGTVSDVMVPVVFSLSETASIGAAARRMIADNLHSVLVTAEDGRIAGILSATDVLAWVAGVTAHR